MQPDTVQAVALVSSQAVSDTFWIELLKLAIFSVFVSATLQVIKDIYRRFHVGDLDSDTVKMLNFGLALAFCYVFDYGVMMRVIQGGVRLKGKIAPYMDYIATASLVYMGADWAFDKFAQMKAKMVAARDQYASPVNTKTTSSSSSSSESQTVEKTS